MGEIVDMMLNGDICDRCGAYLDGDGPGYPRRCKGCQKSEGGSMKQKTFPNDFPITSKVAGISRHQKALEFVRHNTFFILCREPNNRFDANAIAVKAKGKFDLGYIPRDLAEQLAPLLDAGKVSRKATFVRKNVSEKSPDLPVGLMIKIYAKN